jgi:DNA-binding ferritin-like protein
MNIEIINTGSLDNSLDSTRKFGLFLNHFLTSIKMMHWYVTDYNCHQIFGNLYENLNKHFDNLQEEIIGTSKYNKLNFPLINDLNFDINNMQIYQNNESIFSLYKELTTQLQGYLCNLEVTNYINSVNSGINNIKEEILSEINKANYLFSLIKI